jgi:protease-4
MARPSQVVRRAGGNLARVTRRGLAQLALPRRGGFWVGVRLTQPVEDLPRPRMPFAGPPASSLLELLETLETTASDPRVGGVLLRLGPGPLGWSRALSLRRSVEGVREAGKPVVAWADVLSDETLMLASAADRLWLPETGQIYLMGLRMEGLFLRGLLDHLDVKPEVVRVGNFKTAGDRFTRERMSAAEREQLEGLADDLFGELVRNIASGRGLEPAAVRDLIDRGPYHARAAVEAGLADGCRYPDELDAELQALAAVPPPPPGRNARPGDPQVPVVDSTLYHALRASDTGWWPLLSGIPRVAYVVARGAIHRGSGPRGIACDPFRELFEAIRREEETCGLVLRIESPGGDGIASDLLWRAVSRIQGEKPVVVSMGDVVASGGYYMATAADAVLAEAGTVTGSIGVVGGKVNLEGLYERIGVARDGVERGSRAGMMSEARGFTGPEREAVKQGMSALYDAFLDRVSRGRGISGSALDAVAAGRVWSGERARSLGLVDAIGGPLEALREVRRRADLSDEQRIAIDVLPRVPAIPPLRSWLRWTPGRFGWPL